APGHGPQPEGAVHPAMGSAQMGAEDDPGPVTGKVYDGRKTGTDAAVVLDLTVRVEGHIEIHPHKHPFSVNLNVLYCLFLHFLSPAPELSGKRPCTYHRLPGPEI